MAPETHRVPDPCPGSVGPVFIPKVARQYKYLLTVGTVYLAMISPCLEPFQHHFFSRIGSPIQRQRLQAGYVGLLPSGCRAVDNNPVLFGWRHLPQFDQNGASGRGSRRMAALRWIADISS